MVKEGRMRQDFCQSRYFKSWNPDTLGEYNRYDYVVSPHNNLLLLSVTDKHLKYFFKAKGKRDQLLKTRQVFQRFIQCLLFLILDYCYWTSCGGKRMEEDELGVGEEEEGG